ncbi:MAG: hypothetical protein IPH18_00610 [Chitinophagaceae bacterium]|nr:hypothetical protein [Chitinophagaceae bacterium]MBK8951487.1 hypothetical protein [Chitinophagaceae bacterium]
MNDRQAAKLSIYKEVNACSAQNTTITASSNIKPHHPHHFFSSPHSLTLTH